MIRRSPQASPTKNWKIKSAVKEKIRDLSTSLNNFGSLKKQRGAGRLRRPAPLCFLWLPKFFELLLKSRIFSLTADLIFQFFVGEAWGERRIIFWKFKENQNFVFLVIFYVFSQNQLVNINDDIDVKNVYLVDNMSSTYYEGIKNNSCLGHILLLYVFQ